MGQGPVTVIAHVWGHPHLAAPQLGALSWSAYVFRGTCMHGPGGVVLPLTPTPYLCSAARPCPACAPERSAAAAPAWPGVSTSASPAPPSWVRGAGPGMGPLGGVVPGADLLALLAAPAPALGPQAAPCPPGFRRLNGSCVGESGPGAGLGSQQPRAPPKRVRDPRRCPQTWTSVQRASSARTAFAPTRAAASPASATPASCSTRRAAAASVSPGGGYRVGVPERGQNGAAGVWAPPPPAPWGGPDPGPILGGGGPRAPRRPSTPASVSAHQVISEAKGPCFRVLRDGACALPTLRNITKQICCCSRVGKAWGRRCERCPPAGSGERGGEAGLLGSLRASWARTPGLHARACPVLHCRGLQGDLPGWTRLPLLGL